LAAGLVDELTITVIPVLIGQGRPLFGALPAYISLKIIDSKTYYFGFAQVTYMVGKGE
jgi:dihydrofolate reductase